VRLVCEPGLGDGGTRSSSASSLLLFVNMTHHWWVSEKPSSRKPCVVLRAVCSVVRRDAGCPPFELSHRWTHSKTAPASGSHRRRPIEPPTAPYRSTTVDIGGARMSQHTPGGGGFVFKERERECAMAGGGRADTHATHGRDRSCPARCPPWPSAACRVCQDSGNGRRRPHQRRAPPPPACTPTSTPTPP
jgi:hypothetical protein